MFAKIFAQIFDSSISSDYVVRHIFMDLLVLADRDGVVDMTLDAIARRTNIPSEVVSHAIAELMREDRASRSHEEDGRRIIPIDSHRDWGWQIVNYEHYRDIKDEEARRTYFRDRKREQRLKSTTVHTCPQLSTHVKDSPTVSNNVTQAEVEADTEAKAKNKQLLLPAVIRLPATGGKQYSVTQPQVERWEELFPAVDVMQQLRAMVAWLEANPVKRKTTSGMARFAANWLMKAQNRGNNGSHTNGNGRGFATKGEHNQRVLDDYIRSLEAEDSDGPEANGHDAGRDTRPGSTAALFGSPSKRAS